MSQSATTSMRAVPGSTPEERAAQGKEARSRSPRSGHAVYRPSPDRPDPLAILEEQSEVRVPELVPIRYSRMSESPFRFYRGAAAIMASDLAGSPDSGVTVQLCGDAHLLNFRLLASPERRLMFDINDFDETLPGPWEWDVKRLAASFVIAGRANGFDDAERAGIVSAAVRSYREAMRGFAGMGNLDVWYAKIDADRLEALTTDQLDKSGRKKLARALEKARSRDTLQVFDKLTELVGGRPSIAADPRCWYRSRTCCRTSSAGSSRAGSAACWTPTASRWRVTGGRSWRTTTWRTWPARWSASAASEPAAGSCCCSAATAGTPLPAGQGSRHLRARPHIGTSRYRNQGERVVSGQRLMQAASDIFLGWERVDGIDGKQRDFYVRQLRDWKGIAMPETMSPAQLQTFGEVCGITLARAHARSGDRIAIAAYLGRSEAFDRALVTFAEAYADQNERDHQALVDAVRAGRLPAQELPGA